MQKKENRGAKKGRKITWHTRPDVEKVKDVNMSFRTTVEEREEIKKLLKEIGKGTTSEKIIKGLKELIK
ncbi:hypothetical protein EII29_10125 [Leptotrichia sp. OH3620_COT-345]|uniref:hypothetical protein n=1 Tax=Leptotrichia sp. OH3620_COT-345 TaxID=2491048 RepID=UPI000F645537|nr:hypothetical protein [Leptotrichia sp. OH3620_COT-345]RRD38454.1 hypothetical protein EII29_10125 [Leptotrichia sp. OH3620_COT-345]